jgi:glycosyltransferase involved in cell wall biosynthesis
VFLARLHERKRPLAFLHAARSILRSGVDAEFVLAGPDEGEARAVQRFIDTESSAKLTYIGPLDHDASMALLAGADIFVLPSVDEPYPLTVLEALSFETPVVITNRCGLADAVETNDCGFVVGDSDVELAARVSDLIRDESMRRQMGRSGRRFIEAHSSMAAVVDELQDAYTAAIEAK